MQHIQEVATLLYTIDNESMVRKSQNNTRFGYSKRLTKYLKCCNATEIWNSSKTKRNNRIKGNKSVNMINVQLNVMSFYDQYCCYSLIILKEIAIFKKNVNMFMTSAII